MVTLKPLIKYPHVNSEAYNPAFTLGREYNINKAKQLLEEAGYPNGFKTTIIAAPSGDSNMPIAIQADLAKVGIQAEIESPQIGRFITYMGPGTWPENAVLLMDMQTVGVNYLGVLQSAFSKIGQSWLRPPELMQTYQAALSSPSPDVNLTRAVTDLMTKDVLLIPVSEGMSGIVSAPYVVTGYKERGTQREWNAEEAWVNK